jgi:hypothetical protein
MSFLIKIGTKRAPKVHEIRNGRPLCGGGRGGKSILHWQEDIGPANCGACKRLLEKAAKKAREAISQ